MNRSYACKLSEKHVYVHARCACIICRISVNVHTTLCVPDRESARIHRSTVHACVRLSSEKYDPQVGVFQSNSAQPLCIDPPPRVCGVANAKILY